MSDKQDELMETTVSEEPNIDHLKEEEKEKLAAAEEAYAKKQTSSANGSAAAPEQTRPRRRRRHRGGKGGGWVPGLILVGLGVIFLLNNVTDMHIDNWWALFILIPAFANFSKAADSIRRQGEFTRQAWGALVGGVIFSLVAAAFLFDLDWSLIWPAFLIIGGLGLLMGGLKKW